MTSNFSLQIILDLMQNRADDAAKALGKLILAEKDAKARIVLLEDYRTEYSARFITSAENGLSPRQWANFQDFLGKLDEAIMQQHQIVDASVRRTTEGQQHWIDQRNRVRAFDTLAQKHEAEVRYQEHRQDQKLHDELSARQHQDKSENS